MVRNSACLGVGDGARPESPETALVHPGLRAAAAGISSR